jgi:hypothetical protein
MSSGPAASAQCGVQEETGLETTDGAVAWTRYASTDTTYGAQMANAIYYCLAMDPCFNDCLF